MMILETNRCQPGSRYRTELDYAYLTYHTRARTRIGFVVFFVFLGSLLSFLGIVVSDQRCSSVLHTVEDGKPK